MWLIDYLIHCNFVGGERVGGEGFTMASISTSWRMAIQNNDISIHGFKPMSKRDRKKKKKD